MRPNHSPLFLGGHASKNLPWVGAQVANLLITQYLGVFRRTPSKLFIGATPLNS